MLMWKYQKNIRVPFLGWGLLLFPGVDGLRSVLVSVLGLESVFRDRSVTAESSEGRESFKPRSPSVSSGRAAGHKHS